MGDLAGVLCGHGQVVTFAGAAARLSVVVDERWRGQALSSEYAARGIDAEVTAAESGLPLVRTAFESDLRGLAAAWTRGSVKSVPAGFVLDGAALRMWLLTCGKRCPGGFWLQLDPRAPDTHQPLLHRVVEAGLAPAAGSAQARVFGVRRGRPALRVTGAKRVRRLAELVGSAPSEAGGCWPDQRGVLAA